MNSKFKLIIGILIFIVFLDIVYLVYTNFSDNYEPYSLSDLTQQNDKASDKASADDFVVYDKSGNEVRLSDFRGKPVVLNFWASWCPPCKTEMPYFNDAYLANRDQVVFLLVDQVDNQRETPEIGQKYVAGQGYSFPVYFDSAQDATKTYRAYSIPVTYFINAEGRIVSTHRGGISAEKLKQGINSIK